MFAVKVAPARAVVHERGVLEVLGPDARDQLLAASIAAQRARAAPRGSGTSTIGSLTCPPRPSAGMKFMAGEPMKPATNRFCGVS